MKINKAKLDEAIRLNKKYYRTGDKDLIKPLLDAEEKALPGESHWSGSLLTAITLRRRDYSEPYKTYYDVLQLLGVEIVEEEKKDGC